MLVDCDVVIEFGLALFSFSINIRGYWQQLQCWFIQLIKKLSVVGTQMMGDFVIELDKQWVDSCVQLSNAEELMVMQLCQYPALSQQYCVLCLCFIFWFVWSGGHNCCVIMCGYICVGLVDYGIIKAGLGDFSFQVVRDDLGSYFIEEVQGVDMACDLIWQGLCSGCFDICVI